MSELENKIWLGLHFGASTSDGYLIEASSILDTNLGLSLQDTINNLSSSANDFTSLIDNIIIGVSYDSSSKKISFTNNDGDTVSTLDASEFFDEYTAGDGITISDTVVSVDDDYIKSLIEANTTEYTAGDGITISDTVVSVDDDYIKSLIEANTTEYTAGDGITISDDNVVSIKIADDSEFLYVDEDGLKASGISDAINSAVTTVNETIEQIYDELKTLINSDSGYCFMVRSYGDSDPTASEFLGSYDNLHTILSHLRMAAIRKQGDYDLLAENRITLSEDNEDISIDGSDGDIMCATDAKIYLYAEKIEATDGTVEIFGLGLLPVVLYDKEAVGYDPFAIACDAAVYALLTSENTDHIATDDTRSLLHCVYNENISGQYTAPNSLYTTTYKSSGAGYANGSYTTLNEILHALDKNEDDTTNYPYMGLYYRFVEIWMAAAMCELGTRDISATDLLGPGCTSTSVASEDTFADENITAGSGVKVITSDGTVLTVGNIYSGTSILDADGTSRYCYTGLDSTSYACSLLPMMTPQRIIDKIAANDNMGYINDSSIVFDEDGVTHTDIDVSTGDGMEDGSRYYIVRDCPGAESFSDGVMTGVVNCYIKMTPNDGCTYSDGTDLTGGAVIFKLSTLLYRGFTWSTGHWIWMQGFHYVIHTDEDGNRYVTAIYQRDPSKIPAWNGGTYYCVEADGDTDYEDGYDSDDTQLSYTTGWGKSCNPSVSLFYYDTTGGAQHTYECAYTWRNNSYSGSTSAGYKSVNASAFGGAGYYTSAAAGSLDGGVSVASSDTFRAASFSLRDYMSED